MPVEGGVDRCGVRRAVGQVAVVVVDRAELRKPGGRAATVGVGESAVVGVAARSQARLVPEFVGELPRRGGVESRRGQVADREIPERLGPDVPFAVNFLATRPGPALAVGRQESRRRGGRVARARRVVDVPDSRAVQAGVPVAAAVVRHVEAAPDARHVSRHERDDVGVGLARVVQAAAVVCVETVTPLVEENARDLAGVAAAAAGLEEVDARSVPVGVAGLVEVHVVGQLRGQPGAGGQPVTPVLGDPVEVVKAGARGVRVARGRSRRDRAVGSRATRQVEIVVARNRLRDRPTRVDHPDVLAGQCRRRGGAAGRAAEGARRTRCLGSGVDRDVRERHRVVGLLDAVGGKLVVGHGVNAPLGLGVVVDVAERSDRPGVGVDQRFPRSGLAFDLERQTPDQGRSVARAEGARVRSARGRPGAQRDQLQASLVDHPDAVGHVQAHVGGQAREGLGRLDIGNRIGVDAAPPRGAEGDQVAVADGEDVALAHDGNARDGAAEGDLPHVGGQRPGGRTIEDQLRVVREEQRLAPGDERSQGRRDRFDRGAFRDGPGEASPFDEERRTRPAIEVDRPGLSMRGTERLPGPARTLSRRQGGHGCRGHVERLGRILDDQRVESARLLSNLEGDGRACRDQKEGKKNRDRCSPPANRVLHGASPATDILPNRPSPSSRIVRTLHLHRAGRRRRWCPSSPR